MSSKKPLDPKIKKYLLMAVKLTVSSGLLYYVLSKAGIDKVFAILRSVNPYIFLFAVVTYICSIMVSSFRWQLLLPEHYSVRRLFPLYIMGSFFNVFLPGLVGGDAVKIYYLYKETGKGTQALASVFMDRFIGFTMLMTLGISAFPFGYQYFTGEGERFKFVLPAIVAAFFAASALIFGLRLGKRFKVLHSVHEYFHSYIRKPAIIAKALMLSAIVQVAIIFSIYVLANWGFHLPIPFISLLIFVPIITTLSTLPISISGAGIREGATVILLANINIDAASATALAFSMFLVPACGSLPGLYEYLRNKDHVIPQQ